MNISIMNVEATSSENFLKFDYEIECNGFELCATIDTEPKCYFAKDYNEETNDLVFKDRTYMNDVPNVKIHSTDCFDDQSYFTTEVQCEIMRLVLTDYHTRKLTYLI